VCPIVRIWILQRTPLSKALKIKIYKTVILCVFLYGFQTWSLILREGYRLKVSENRVVRRISGPKGDDVSGEQRN
jgi:hypothetical protein